MGNTIRFTGLASGLDTESIVKAIMTPYQNKIDTLNKNKILAEWKKDAYKELSNKIHDFNTKALDKIKYQGTLNKNKATVSQEGFIKINTADCKEETNHSIQVLELAKNANVDTSVIRADDGSKYTKNSLVSSVTGSGSGSFKINDVEIRYDSTTTIEQLEKKVEVEMKAAGKETVNFKYDEGAGAFLISSKETGSKQQIKLEGADGTLGKLGITQGQFNGHSAKIKYNGGLTIESETNDIEVGGIKFTAVAKTTEPITVNVSKDVDGIIEAVTEFVGEYNKLLTEMNTKLGADSAKGYEPLTDEEKEAMSDKEIELWEKKIKDSLLADNDTLSDIQGAIRGVMSGNYKGEDGISDECSMLHHIGLDSTNWRDRGKITIDEDKLKEAVFNNPEGVVSLITKIGTKMSKELNERCSGVAGLRSPKQYFNDLTQDANIRDYSNKLLTEKARYDRLESMNYAKFTAMEQAMQQMNSQSNLFGGM